jgi:hypothetical protein
VCYGPTLNTAAVLLSCYGNVPPERAAQVIGMLLERYDTAAFGRTHNRLRDWDSGNHPGYALGCWLEQYREQLFLFTRNFAVS